MRIFLSYASEDAGVAEEIAHALKGSGHTVFFDRASIGSGEDFHTRIRSAVARADLFVFLASSASLEEGSYTLSELRMARGKWPRPEGHLLPVMLPTGSIEELPPFLRSVTVLEPEGNVAADVAARVAEMRPAKGRKVAIIAGGAAVAGLALWAGLTLLPPESGNGGASSPEPPPDSQRADLSPSPPRSRSFEIVFPDGRGPFDAASAAIRNHLPTDFASSEGDNLLIELSPPRRRPINGGDYTSPEASLTVKVNGGPCSEASVELPPFLGGNRKDVLEGLVDKAIAVRADTVYQGIAQCAGL